MHEETYRVLTELYDPDYTGIGWLTPEEIDAALAHESISRRDLSLAVLVVLNAMEFLELQLGPDRVRLVFAIE